MGRDPAWWLQALALHGCIPRAGSQADRPPSPRVSSLQPAPLRVPESAPWELGFVVVFFFLMAWAGRLGINRAAAASHCSAASPAAPANFPALLPGPGRAGPGLAGRGGKNETLFAWPQLKSLALWAKGTFAVM
ncbi:unnamed protein product [Lepidochelys olivacea]